MERTIVVRLNSDGVEISRQTIRTSKSDADETDTLRNAVSHLMDEAGHLSVGDTITIFDASLPLLEKVWLAYSPPSDEEGRGPMRLDTVWGNKAACTKFVNSHTKNAWGGVMAPGTGWKIEAHSVVRNNADLETLRDERVRESALRKLRSAGLNDAEKAALGITI